ncbi:signal transduction histidine kinase [Streptomyces phaeochromogenes]|uniref:sensor histidine kinase n=1 Tax=Streptomyces phaeochromogenes TaxID=1923 RepID=UPI0027926A18|nr:HAMP domain-containing sensor histidine kinase [Streptomyces phaeochromogenes]MDQ0951291.1 signal transduction histidine kinase [Streptomyces phaeochromogenes]
MRTRVQAALLLFVVIAVAAFAVPLLLFTASDRTQQLVLARSADLDRFASLMDQAAATGDTSAVTAEVRRYTQLYGEALVVTDTRRNPVVQTGGMRAADPAVARLLDAALRNQTAHPGGALRPWSRGHRMFAEPAGTGTRVSGAVVLRASVETAADDITRRWAAVLAGAALAAVACTVLARAATGWVVSPLRRLDRAVGQLAAGLPPEQTRAGGPPELRQLAIGFNRMARTVTAALEQQRRLVADTSHQMRNPMAALRLRVDALHTHLPVSADRTYSGVTTELDRLESLLDDLLALATAEQRAGELTVTDGSDARCDAAAVAAAQHRLWEPVAHRAGARLALRAAPAPVPAACTDRELAQITDILLDNAIKYAGPGAEISLRCTTEGPLSVLTVTDDGPGLGTEELALATTRFWRSGRQREDGTTGTGLGLAIAEQLLAGRGGRLELGPAHPRGLRARAIVPRAETDGVDGADRADGADGGDGGDGGAR